MGFDWLPIKNYKRHYICLKCQKGFKRPSEDNMKHSESTDLSNLMNEYYASGTQQDIVKYICASHQQMKAVCPNCQHTMLQVHYNFEVPPQRDNKAWKILQKTMPSEIAIEYDIYIQWHHIELLNKADATSAKFKLLKQNLAKLEKLSTD